MCVCVRACARVHSGVRVCGYGREGRGGGGGCGEAKKRRVNSLEISARVNSPSAPKASRRAMPNDRERHLDIVSIRTELPVVGACGICRN